MFSPPRSPLRTIRIPRSPRAPGTPPRRFTHRYRLPSVLTSRSSWVSGLVLVNLVTVVMFLNHKHAEDHHARITAESVREAWQSHVQTAGGPLQAEEPSMTTDASAAAKLSNQQPKEPGPAPTPVDMKGSYLAMCAVVKDQHADIREWVQYHHWLGVVKFYIYDHNSTVPVLEELEDWIKAGIVEYSIFSGHHQLKPRKIFGNTAQGYVYNDCLQRSRGRHQWLAFIDVDEFLVLYEQGQRNVSEFLRQYEPYGALGVNWRVFGSSGHVHKPQSSTLESYTRCLPDEHKENWHIKTIANVPYTCGIGSTPHHFEFFPGYSAVNEFEQPCNQSWCVPASHKRIGLHHYVVKSLDEYRVKMVRGGGSGSVKGMNFFELIDSWATATCTQAVECGRQCFAEPAPSDTGELVET